MLLITADHIRQLIASMGLDDFNLKLIDRLETDFTRWDDFDLSPRHAIHLPHGVMELMPCADQQYYSYKFVNGHPLNVKQGKLSIVALGMLAEMAHGFPLMISDMTILTALRTAATAALGARYLARPESECLAIIGTGAQSEFQVRALMSVLPLKRIRYFDIDASAMRKFSSNLADQSLLLHAAQDIHKAIKGADIIITATADKRCTQLFKASDIAPGTHIHGIGGDCPGKTELDPALLDRAMVVVEYREQSLLEGEAQHGAADKVDAELHEIIRSIKPGRTSNDQITLFDSVGFAVEDYSVLRLVYELSQSTGIGDSIDLLPEPDDPKNLYGVLCKP